MEAWKKYYVPIKIGKKLMIVPSWMDMKDKTRIAIKINPSMAFGTGTHPTTQLCLEHLEKYILPGQPMIDIGCGSGILSIAAIKLGASQALAVDIDNAAVQNTRSNAKINGIAKKIETGIGSAAEVLGMSYSLYQAPVVVANILTTVLIRLLNERLPDLVPDEGVLILSGILVTQFAEIDYEARKIGLKLIDKRTKKDWVSPVYQK